MISRQVWLTFVPLAVCTDIIALPLRQCLDGVLIVV